MSLSSLLSSIPIIGSLFSAVPSTTVAPKVSTTTPPTTGSQSFGGMDTTTFKPAIQNVGPTTQVDTSKFNVQTSGIQGQGGLGANSISEQLAGLRQDISKMGQTSPMDTLINAGVALAPAFMQYKLGKDALEDERKTKNFAMRNTYTKAQNELRRSRSVKDSLHERQHDSKNDARDYTPPPTL